MIKRMDEFTELNNVIKRAERFFIGVGLAGVTMLTSSLPGPGPLELAYKAYAHNDLSKLDVIFAKAATRAAALCTPQQQATGHVFQQLDGMTSRDRLPGRYTFFFNMHYNRLSAPEMNKFLATLENKGIVYAGKAQSPLGNDGAALYEMRAVYYNGTAANPAAKTLVVNEDRMESYSEKNRLMPLIEDEILNKPHLPGETIVILNRSPWYSGNQSVYRLPPGQSSITTPGTPYAIPVPPNPCAG